MKRITSVVLSALIILMGMSMAAFAKESIDRTITFDNVTGLTSDGELRYLGIYSTKLESRQNCAINVDAKYTHNGSEQSIVFYPSTTNRTFFYNTDSAIIMRGDAVNAQTVGNCYRFEYKYYFKMHEFESSYAGGVVLSDDPLFSYGTSTSYRFLAGLRLEVKSDADGKRIKLTDAASTSIQPWDNGENDWVEIKRIFDFENSAIDTYANGELLLSKQVDNLTAVRYAAISVKGSNTESGIFFDDISSKSIERPPVIDAVEAEKDSVALIFSKALDAATVTADSVSLSIGGKSVGIDSVNYTAGETRVIVKPSRLLNLTEEYLLTVSGGITSVGGAPLGGGEPTEKRFTIAAAPFDILRVSAAGGKITADLVNTTGEAKTAVMAALFKNAAGSTVACVFSPTTPITAEGTALTAALPGKGETSCEVFFVDNWSTRLVLQKYIYNIEEVN